MPHDLWVIPFEFFTVNKSRESRQLPPSLDLSDDDPNPTTDSIMFGAAKESLLCSGRLINIIDPGSAHALYRDSACRVDSFAVLLFYTDWPYLCKGYLWASERENEEKDPIRST